jgi:hypothetical protein
MTDNIERFSHYYNKIGTPAELKELYASGRLPHSLGTKLIEKMDADKAYADQILQAAFDQLRSEKVDNLARCPSRMPMVCRRARLRSCWTIRAARAGVGLDRPAQQRRPRQCGSLQQNQDRIF